MILYNTKQYTILLVALCIASLPSYAQPPATPLILGSFQFPQTIMSVPVPRIYHMGKTIPCEVHEGTKKVTFDLPKQKDLHHFCLLITESIRYELKKNDFVDQQTVDYMYVPAGKPFKYYELTLINEEDADQKKLYWEIKEKKQFASHMQSIPDEAIVVLYSPEYIEGLSGGTSLELPIITIKPDVVDLAGSAENLYESSIKLQLASLNSDTIHLPVKHVVKQVGQRTLIAPAA
jgi:hypothetical protein